LRDLRFEYIEVNRGQLQPLLEATGRLWVTAFPKQIESASARAAYEELAGRRGWLPPLDEYQEEEEMFP
jgi:hypothetical protein